MPCVWEGAFLTPRGSISSVRRRCQASYIVEFRSKSLHSKRVPMRLSVFKDDGVEQQPPTFEVPTIKSRGGGDLGGGGGGLGEGGRGG
jgi:hypothetical protein